MTRTEKQNLTVTAIGAILICAGFLLVSTGSKVAGVVLSFIGSLTLAVCGAWLFVQSRQNRNR